MSANELLNNIKRFLPNNTANKLLSSDELDIEKGTVIIARYGNLFDIFKDLRAEENFAIIFRDIMNKMVSSFLDTIYDNGGVFLKFDIQQMEIIIDCNLNDAEIERTSLQAISLAFSLKKVYNRFIEEINNKYNFELEPDIKFGINSGSFIDLLIGNDKRKERILLGTTIKKALEISYEGKPGNILITNDLYSSIKKEVVANKRTRFYTVKELKNEIALIKLPHDNYLNLKTSIIRTFLPGYLFKLLKDTDPSADFCDYKDGSVIILELSGIHLQAEKFLNEYPKLKDATEKKIFLDNFFFGLNKLFKKIFRFTVNFDGTINKVDISKFGLRITITFSFPTTFENNAKNKNICVEEINKIASSFKNFDHKILFFDDKMFSSIVGCKERAAYIVTSEAFKDLDNIIADIDNYCIKKIGTNGDNSSECYKLKKPPRKKRGRISEVEKREELLQNSKLGIDQASNTDEEISLTGLFKHKVIGRNKEIIFLNQLLRESGKIITITGQYGSGKTRIIEELSSRMKNEGFHILHSKVENRDSIIDLFKYLIEEESEITIFDEHQEVEEKLNKYFDHLLSFSPEDSEKELFKEKRFILYKILYNIDIKGSVYDSLSPELRLENLKEALSLFIIFNYYHYHKENREGVIFIFDDIDNLKHEEKDLMQYVIQYALSHLVERGNRRNKKSEINKISFIISHHVSENLDFNKFLKPVRLELTPLKKETMKLLLKELVNSKKIPSEIEKVLLKRSIGNPFYLEQFFRYMFTKDMIKEEATELLKTKKYKKKLVPKSITDVVIENLKELDTDLLEHLQAASVVGVKFDIKIVDEYYKSCDSVCLERLLETNFIKRYHKDNSFIFTHPMVSDVVYKMASDENKIKWHKNVAAFIEGTSETSKIYHPRWLGYHYNRANDTINAQKSLKKAYEHANDRNFLESAYNNLEKFCSYLEEGVEKELTTMNLLNLLYKMKNYKEAKKLTNKMLKDCEVNKNYKFHYDLLSVIISGTIDYSPVYKIKILLHKQSKLLSKTKITAKQKGILYKSYAILKLNEDKTKDGIDYLKRAIKFSTTAKDDENICFLKNRLGEIYEDQFRYNKGIEIFKVALNRADKSNNLEFKSIALGNLGKITYKLGRVKEAIGYYDKALETASLLSLKDVEAKCASELGNIYLETRNLAKAQDNMERSLKIFRALNNLEEISYRLSDFGECFIYQNNPIEAEKSFNRSYKISKEINSSIARAYSLLNIGRLKVMKKSYEEAEETFKESIKIYREKKLYKRIGMIYYFLAEMHYKQIIEFDDDPFMKYKHKTKEDISEILKYMKYSLSYSKKAKNIHYISKGYLLLGRILNRKNKSKLAIENLSLGLTNAKISDYSKLQVKLAMELAIAYEKKNRKRDSILVLKAVLKAAKKHNDINSTNIITDKIKDLKKI